MLVLTRKIGQHITIGDDAIVVVQSVAGNKVRLAIGASPQTKILRGELSPFCDRPALGIGDHSPESANTCSGLIHG